jgi:hypothetical protein
MRSESQNVVNDVEVVRTRVDGGGTCFSSGDRPDD